MISWILFSVLLPLPFFSLIQAYFSHKLLFPQTLITVDSVITENIVLASKNRRCGVFGVKYERT